MPKFDFVTSTTDNGVEDIVLDSKGEFQFTSTIQESLAQRLSHRLNTWQGEWEYNLLYGTPWEQRILGSGKTKEQVDAELLRVILEEEDITSVGDIISKKDPYNRIYEVERVDVYCNNTLLTIPISDPNRRLNIYPDPRTSDDFSICSLGETTFEDINALYAQINYEMSNDNGGVPGDSTWWNIWSTNLP